MNKINFTLLIVACFGFAGATYRYADTKPAFTYKVYGNIASYFESEKDLLDFFEFRKGDVVAEVGAADGQNLGGLSILTDSLTLYAEDIDSLVLTQKHIDKTIKHCEKYKKPLTNKIKLCIGREKATLLPGAAFDKILLLATFHEFTYMDEMIPDIKSKLKPNGKLYILESHCFNKKHNNYTAAQTIALLGKHGFRLVKKDGKDLNNSSGLYRTVFSRN